MLLALTLAAGTYAYAGTYDGATAGTSSVTVRTTATGATLIEKATGAINGMEMEASATLGLGANLDPTVYDGSYQSGTLDTVVTVTIRPTAATVIANTSAGQPAIFPLKDGAQHFVVIEPGLVSGLFALPVQMQLWNYAPFLVVAPSVARAANVELDTSAKPQRPADVPAKDLQLSFGGPYAFTIWYDPATLVPDEIVMPSQKLVITRVRQGP
ncbi:MAG: hypothetical protein JOY98_14710 [Candidatus Eremiobacteraeota bacterium]|nr:hypothetical protein [Candidatus Eremiobacteraeota bacterium]